MATRPRPNTKRAGYLVLDLETVPDTPRWVKPECPPGTEPPFPPTWAHRIIAIGCLWFDADYQCKRLGLIRGVRGVLEKASEDRLEAELLSELSGFLSKERPVLVTFNGRSFDLPVIVLRALRHGQPLPWHYQGHTQHRYSEDGHIDLCDILANRGAARMGSLDAITKLMGLPGKGGVDGTQVEALHKTGAHDVIERYCLDDVAQTAFLFLRLRLLQGHLSLEAYTKAAAELFAAIEKDGRLIDLLGRMDRGHVLLTPAPLAANESTATGRPLSDSERDEFFPYLDTGTGA